MLVLFISPAIIGLVRNATVTIQVFALNLAKKAHELKVEKKKADKLLFQMLPPTVAMSLQQKKKVNAESYESVTIYFRELQKYFSPLPTHNIVQNNKQISWKFYVPIPMIRYFFLEF